MLDLCLLNSFSLLVLLSLHETGKGVKWRGMECSEFQMMAKAQGKKYKLHKTHC